MISVRTCVWQSALLLRFNSEGVGLLKTAKPVCFPLIYDPSTLSPVSPFDHLWVLPYTWRPQPALGSGRGHRVTRWSEDAFHNNFKTLRWPSILSKLPGFCHPRRCTVKVILRGFRKSNYTTSRFKRWRANGGLLWFSSHAVLKHRCLRRSYQIVCHRLIQAINRIRDVGMVLASFKASIHLSRRGRGGGPSKNAEICQLRDTQRNTQASPLGCGFARYIKPTIVDVDFV